MKVSWLMLALVVLLSKVGGASINENACILSYQNEILGAAVAETGVASNRYFTAKHIIPAACEATPAECSFRVDCLGRSGGWQRTVSFRYFLENEVALLEGVAKKNHKIKKSRGMPHHCLTVVPWSEDEMLERQQQSRILAAGLKRLSSFTSKGSGLVPAFEYMFGNFIPDSIKMIPFDEKRELYVNALQSWSDRNIEVGSASKNLGALFHPGWHVIQSNIGYFRREGASLYSDCDGWYGGSGSGVFDANGQLLAITQGFADEVSYIFRASAVIGLTRHTFIVKGAAD